MEKKDKIDRKKTLKYLFLETIKDTIADEILNSSLDIKEIEMNNATFFTRVLRNFVKNTQNYYSLEEIKDFIKEDIIIEEE